MDRVKEMMELITSVLDRENFSYTVCDEATVETGITGRTGVFNVLFALRGQPLKLGVVAQIPEIVPEEKRPAMAEALTRANRGLALGCFELEMSDGRMHFRAAMPVSDGQIGEEQIQDLFYHALSYTDAYHRAFCRLIYADDLSAAEVIAEVEMARPDE